nr:hypothetical protein [Tanacetum cinerariifolium]
MTRSLKKELVTPYKEPERVLCSAWKLFKTMSLDYSGSPKFNLFSNLEDQCEEVVEAMGEPTMEEYITKTRQDYGLGIARPEIDERATQLIDDSYEEKEVLGKLIDRRESTTNLKRLLREKPRMRYQIEASINVHDSPEWSRHVTIVHQTKDLHTTDYTQLYDFLKYNQKEVDELKAERLTKTQDPLALMANSNNPYVFPAPHQDKSSFIHNYLQQPMPNPEDITDPTTVMNMALALMAKAFKLNYSTPTNNNQRISSNPRNKQIAQPGNPASYNDGIGNQVIQNAVQNPRVQNVRNPNGLIGVQRNGNQNQIGNGNLVVARAEGNIAGQNGNQIRCYNCRGVGHYARNCTVRPRRRDAAYLQTQLLIAQKEEAGIQLHAEEYDLMAAAADLDKIKEVNVNCILMANLQQASTSGTQIDSAPVYDIDGSAEPDSFYHSEQKMALGYQNPFYLKQAQKKQQSLYDGKVLHEKHDPPVVHDSEETLQLAQENREKMK